MNTFGDLFKVSIFGESHGDSVGVIVDGVKPGIPVSIDELYSLILRRKSGTKGTTKRIETDYPQILSGVYNGFTTGSPINITFKNSDQHSSDYANLVYQPRPGHADFVANKKYNGFQDYRGGGHFSGRLTLALVAAGYFAMKMIPFTISSHTRQIGSLTNFSNEELEKYLSSVIDAKDSVGGIIDVKASNMEIGLGEPFFNSIESKVSALMFSVPAVKGLEFGLGFRGSSLRGSEFNDCFLDENGKTKTNNNGGINGGISNGNDLCVSVFVKPTPSIGLSQETYSFKENNVSSLEIHGRHDACIALRAPVVLESCLAIALADLYMIKKKWLD